MPLRVVTVGPGVLLPFWLPTPLGLPGLPGKPMPLAALPCRGLHSAPSSLVPRSLRA